MLAHAEVGPYLGFQFVQTGWIYNKTLIILDLDTFAGFACVQSRIHETWVRLLASSMKDDLRYTASDCFETYPFPREFESNASLEKAGQEYYEFRAALMISNNEGLTKTYNRFHDPNERQTDILRLRELHAAMDRAVLDAYGWSDIPTECDFFLD